MITMCKECPGKFEFVEEKVKGISPNELHSKNPKYNTMKTVRKKIMRPCTCHCGSGPVERNSSGRKYCPACSHWL